MGGRGRIWFESHSIDGEAIVLIFLFRWHIIFLSLTTYGSDMFATGELYMPKSE
jgi:hypothetical protein